MDEGPIARLVDVQVDAEVGGRVQAVMFRRRVTQVQLAEALGLDGSTVSRKLHGDRPWSVAELVAVARFLDVPAAQFLPAEAA